MAQDKLGGLLGLSIRAGHLASGEVACQALLKKGQAALILIDEAASANTRKRYSDAGAYRQVPVYILPQGLMERSIGREGRMVAAVQKGTLARQIENLLGHSE